MGRLPQTNTSVSRYLRQQKRVVTRLANSTPYALSGTSVVAPGLTKVDERLVAGTPGGSRVELDSAGLRKYATDGTTVQVDLTGEVAAFSGLITGSEIVGGRLRTDATGNRIEVVPDGDYGGEIRFYTGDPDEAYYGYILSYSTDHLGGSTAVVSIGPPQIIGSRPGLVMSNTKSDDGTAFDSTYVELYADLVELGATAAGNRVAIVSPILSTGLQSVDIAERFDREWVKLRVYVVDGSLGPGSGSISSLLAYSATPTVAVPLLVWDTNATPGQELKYTTNGTTWTVIGGGGAAASETVAGIVELATPAETVTGTDTVRAVTPAGVKAAIDAIGASTGVSYSAGWADYGAPFSPVTWYKDKDGYIRLSGLVLRTGATITASGSGTIFTLPVGARPAGIEAFVMNKDGAICPILIGTDGVVDAGNPATWTSGSSYLTLGGVMFRAA